MKVYKNIFKSLGILFALVLSACSYDRDIANPEQYSRIYIPQAFAGAIYKQLPMSDVDYEFPLGAAFGGLNQLGSAVTVSLRVENNLVEDYNVINQTTYLKFPEGSYTLEKPDVKINTGTSSSDVVKLKIKTFGKLEVGKTYLLPVSIAQVSPEIPINPKLRTVYYVVKPVFSRINRAAWTVYDISGDENENARGGRGISSIDGDPITIWSSPWRLSQPNPPHYIAFDLGKLETLYGVVILARRANNGTEVVYHAGVPKDVVLEISENGTTWTVAKSVQLPHQLTSEIFFDKAERGRYLKITVNSTNNAFYQTSIAEINAF